MLSIVLRECGLRHVAVANECCSESNVRVYDDYLQAPYNHRNHGTSRTVGLTACHGGCAEVLAHRMLKQLYNKKHSGFYRHDEGLKPAANGQQPVASGHALMRPIN